MPAKNLPAPVKPAQTLPAPPTVSGEYSLVVRDRKRMNMTSKERKADAEKEKAKVLAVRQNMNKNLLKATLDIEGKMNKMSRGMIDTIWAIGRELRIIQADPKKFGENAINNIFEATDSRWRSYIYKGLTLNNWIKDEEELQALHERWREAGKGGASWVHVDKLMTISKPAERDKMLTRVLTEDMSPGELQMAINSYNESNGGTGKAHAGGRPMKIPGTPLGKVATLEKVTNQFRKSLKLIWLDQTHGFEKMADELPADKVSNELLDNLRRVEAEVETMEDQVATLKKSLTTARAKLVAKQEAQAKLDAKKAAAGLDNQVAKTAKLLGHTPTPADDADEADDEEPADAELDAVEAELLPGAEALVGATAEV